jgi:hypothetical protein
MSPVNKKVSEALRQLYDKEPDFGKAFDYLASRSNNAAETKVERLAYLTDLPRNRIIQFMRAMEGLGLGQFIVGRKQWPSRFKWSVGLISVGQVASRESDEVSTDDLDEGSEEEMELAAEAVTYEVPLRPDMKAKLTIPANITKAETVRLSNFIRGLAVDVGELE